MADTRPESKRPAARPRRPKAEPSAAEPAGFGAGIFEEHAAAAPAATEPEPTPAPPPAAEPEPAKPAAEAVPERKPAPSPVDTPRPPYQRRFHQDEEGPRGFDEETNSRYEEIKRGNTYITELQQQTMVQLQKVAKDEGLTDFAGLKKQDLIF